MKGNSLSRSVPEGSEFSRQNSNFLFIFQLENISACHGSSDSASGTSNFFFTQNSRDGIPSRTAEMEAPGQSIKYQSSSLAIRERWIPAEVPAVLQREDYNLSRVATDPFFGSRNFRRNP